MARRCCLTFPRVAGAASPAPRAASLHLHSSLLLLGRRPVVERRVPKLVCYGSPRPSANRIALDPIVADNQRAKVAVVWWGPLHQRGGRLVPIELTSGTSYSTCASLRSRWFKIGSGPGMIRAIFLSFKQVSIRAGDHGFYHSHIHSCLCTAFCIPFGERDKDAQAREGRFGVRRQRGR